ncbi:MAG TPA: FecR domain-containing protein [Candidatus Nanoarchaeia archaeon]|nr:FecR domain-containing protein [Candidatus Nanoarchaeia archaeon]
MKESHGEHHPLKKRSRTVWFVVGALVILAALGYAYYWTTGSPTRTAFLNVESGVVEVDQGKGWLPARDGMDLKKSDKVRTLDGQATIVIFESILVSLDENTEVLVDSLIKEKVAIQQQKGSTWNKVTGLSGVQSYEVSTPNTVATVRGTAFGVDTGAEDSIAVGEGNVGVSSGGQEENVAAFEKVFGKKGNLAKKEWSADDKVKFKKRLTRHLVHLKKLRWAELEKKRPLVEKLKAKYKVTDVDIKKFFEDVDAGKQDDTKIIDKVPLNSEAVHKIKRLNDQIKKEQRLLSSLDA